MVGAIGYTSSIGVKGLRPRELNCEGVKLPEIDVGALIEFDQPGWMFTSSQSRE